MRRWAALLLALAAADPGRAATAYVTDELVLGVYASQNTLGPRLATLHSGALVESLTSNGDATQVRLPDGTTGWVKSAYLTTMQPATVRLKLLQEELARTHAMTPGVADPAQGSDAPRLTRGPRESSMARNAAIRADAPPDSARLPWAWALAVVIALGCGFWLGYASLARRIKYRFGGIKVY